MGYPILQSQTAQPLVFFLASSSDHISGVTGLTPTVTISKNGGAFASPAGAVSEIANGWYKVAGNATDSNTLGPLLLHATGTGADPTDDCFPVVAYNPQDATRLGLTALPNAAASASGGLPTFGTGTGQINPSGGKVPATLASTDVTGNVTADLQTVKTQAVTCAAPITVLANVGTATHALVVDASGFVTVVTNNDKAGYSLTQAFPANFSALGISVGGHISNVDTLTTYTGNTPQTGDTYALANGASGFAAIKTDTGNLVSRVTSTLFSGITSLAQWLGMIAGKQVGNTTARTEIRATGAGSGTYDETADSLEAIRARGDAAWVTATGFSVLTTADIPTTAQVADKFLGRNLAGGSDGGRTVKDALRATRNKVAFDVPGAGQFTVYQEDDTTPAWTGTYTANSGANPVTVIDPA